MVFGKDKKIDDVEKSKILTRANTEGTGIYSCTAPSHPDAFTTTDKEEWDNHLREFKHYQQGSGLCAICGQLVDMNVVLTRAGNNPIHKECIPKPEDEL